MVSQSTNRKNSATRNWSCVILHPQEKTTRVELIYNENSKGANFCEAK